MAVVLFCFERARARLSRIALCSTPPRAALAPSNTLHTHTHAHTHPTTPFARQTNATGIDTKTGAGALRMSTIETFFDARGLKPYTQYTW